MDAPTPVASASASNKGLVTIAVFSVVLAAVVLAVGLYLAPRASSPSQSVRIIENAFDNWYTLSAESMQLARTIAPQWLPAVPEGVLAEGDFSPVVTDMGVVLLLSPVGLEAVDDEGERTVLIERTDLEYGSSAISHDGSGAALYNPVSQAVDFFSLDPAQPAVLSHEGSVSVPGVLYGVGVLPGNMLLLKTGEAEHKLFEVHQGRIEYLGAPSLTPSVLDGVAEVSFFAARIAHAWTYPSSHGSAPVSTNAQTTSNQRCTGTQVASLGTASGSGSMPSVQTTLWSYMPTPGNLPANYNNGSYCIQARTTITYSAPTVSLTASPSSIYSGQSSTLTWSATGATSCTGTGFSTGGATSGSTSVSPTSNTTYTATCTGPGGSGNKSATVTVSAPPQPNLTAGGITPTTATRGTARTFSSVITNSGSGATGAGFTVDFQRATTAAGANVVSVGTYSAAALNAGATVTATRSVTFTTAGTFYLRACADSGGVISETNEGDNCSAWTAITVTTGGGGGGGGCFPYETPVTMADGSTKAIGDVRPGDLVRTGGGIGIGLVVNTIIHEGSYDMLLINGNLSVTPEHRMMVVRDGVRQWMTAGEVRVGDAFVKVDGSLMEITSIEADGTLPTVYNLSIVPDHTYFAGGVLVHNQKQ